MKIGDWIRVIKADGFPSYNGRIGKITSMEENYYFGTWGGFAIIEGRDEVEVLNLNRKEKMKLEIERQLAEHESVIISLRQQLKEL